MNTDTFNMYVVFEDGSRQYRVSEGDVVKVDYREAEIGSRVEFPRVLLYANGTDLKLGQPVIEGLRVLGDVVEHPSTKVYIQKFRRRKNSRRLVGHRQPYTSVRVKHILLAGQEVPVAPPPAPETAPPASTPETTPAASMPETPPPAAPETATATSTPETPPTA